MSKGETNILNSDQTREKRHSIGWMVVFVPLTVVILITFLEDIPWISSHSESGMQAEVLELIKTGERALNNGQFNEAYRCFVTAINQKPDLVESYYNMGELYCRMGNDSLASIWLNRALNLNPRGKHNIYKLLGTIASKNGDFNKALKYLTAATEFGIDAWSTWNAIGELEMKRKDYPAAIRAYHEVIKAWPTLENLYVDLWKRKLYSEDDGDCLEDAKRHLKEKISSEVLAPYNSSIAIRILNRKPEIEHDYLNLASAYEKNGQTNLAIFHLRSALDNIPEALMIYNQLGIYLAKSDSLEEAEKVFKKALRIDPGNKSFQKNIKHLRRLLVKER